MKLSYDRIELLLNAYLINTISNEELDEVNAMLKEPSNEDSINKFMEHYWKAHVIDESEEIEHKKIFHRILQREEFKKSHATLPNVLRIFRMAWLSSAAAVVVIIGVILLLFNIMEQRQNTGKKLIVANAQKIEGASQKAMLTLADGSQIALKGSAKGTVARQHNVSLDQNNGQLIYNGNLNDQNQLQNNTMTTPKGGFYQLVLQDGTKVWLNAASSITYPVAFSGTERRVKISGEAYFEVAKNAKKPFYVESNGCEVKVLGTSFNVSAYADDDLVTTTLVEGAVKIRSGDNTAIMKPGQQSNISKSSSKIKINNVDTEQALAWKNGYFMFDKQDIRAVMKVIERWYDIEVIYSGNLQGKTFGGTISRSDDIHSLLGNIQLTDAIHFKIQGRRVTVMP